MKNSVVMITLNEEANIAACLETVKWADEIVIVDSGSTDRTLAIAKTFAAKIHTHPFKNFSDQKNTALTHATGDWVFLMDADERVTPELAAEIQKLTKGENVPAAYAVKRTTNLFGHWVHFGGMQDDRPIRLFPKGRARYEQPIHETIRTELPVRQLKNSLLHFSTQSDKAYREKLKLYTDFEIPTMKARGCKLSVWDLLLRPAGKFFYLLLWRFGLLDGPVGFKLAALAAYYDFIKYQKYRASF